MKACFVFLLIVTAAAMSALADGPGMAILYPPAPRPPTEEQLAKERMIQKAAADYWRQQRETAAAYTFALQQQQFMPKDPWRVIAGETNFAKGGNWVHFCGKILEVQPGGVRIEGDFAEPLTVDSDREKEFFVANFPYQVAEGEWALAARCYSAMNAGTHTYSTVAGGSRTIRKLDYGEVCDRPAWVDELAKVQAAAAEEQAKLAKQKNVQKQSESERRAFEFYSRPATNGDAFAQCRLGEFYLTGRGTETNGELARYWLTRAAAAGSVQASNLLSKLKADAPATAAK